MPSTALTNLGINYAWSIGENGWKAGMDFNLAILDLLAQGIITVDPKSVTAQPGSPTNGAVYILASVHTGALWGPRLENDIAIFYTAGWIFVTPLEGWTLYDRVNNKYWLFDGATWVDNLLPYLRPVATAAKTANYQLGLADHQQIIRMNGTSLTLTIPTNATTAIPLGFEATMINNAATSCTLSQAGVTLRGAPTATLTQNQYTRWQKIGTDEWAVIAFG